MQCGCPNDVPVVAAASTINHHILGGGAIHTGLDHYSNYGFV
jgi:hypothetical protein